MLDDTVQPERRCAVVVGDSDGIGLALTRRLLAEGWSVAGLSRRSNDVRDDRYRHETVDVLAPQYPQVLARAVAALGRVDVCVYAAGIGEPLDLTDLAGQTRTLEVNLVGAARTAQVVVPLLVAAGGGHLVGLSSLADALVSPTAPGYAASKAGLSSYLLGLAGALRPHGVFVTAVRFGFVDTKMAKAPVRPFIIPVAEAVDVLMRCLRTRRPVVVHPRRMAVLVWCLARLARMHTAVSRGR
jgi:NAD(P)-dependent dehydrogenase (short-subunit alcohol dehydrogenase family)